jgi:pilus assembly protein CpaB
LRAEEITGRGVTASINRGEPIPENRLAPKGAGAGLASIIPAGMRAAAVRVDEVVGVSGYVLPGMHVDVLSSGTPPGEQGTITRTILQNIEVLSAGQNLERDAQGKPSSVQVVNLLVTPEDAEKLSLASSQMKLQLVLRNPLDAAKVKTAGVTTSGLLLDDRPAVEHTPKAAPKVAPKARLTAQRDRKAEPAPAVMEVIHGSKKVAIVFGQ